MVKAKIFQYGGNRAQAAALTETARHLDKQDRYVNALASKYQFKIDDTKKAEELILLFSAEKDTGKLNVHEM